MNLVIFTDGASRSNPGHAAIGYRITDGKNELESKGEYVGVRTNNEAEYLALIRALKECEKYNPDKIVCFSDSQLMVKQLNGEWRVKKPQLMDYYNDVKRLERAYQRVNYHHVKRDNLGIQVCDSLANQALNQVFRV